MIPGFNDFGYLPPGVHGASLDEIAARFGRNSELRRVQMESLRWLLEMAHRAGVLRIIINGSFVTDVLEPNDVDCVLLMGPGFPRDASAGEQLVGLPFLEVELVDQAGFDYMVERFFATDRDEIHKGMIEVIP